MAKETLFSLEVVVEEVCVLSSTVPCRLPAIAFRLLDFPTLVVHHIEQDVAEKIKTKLTMDPTVEVPPQLQELKDRWGIFNVNKGKSCLFKMDVETLRAHLDNTPLYIMLIDMWPNVPKLVGNSTIPLNVTMDKICRDIENHDISTPFVHGEKGRYKLYNLMSTEIGFISMGFRLLSLGPGLIQHIPDQAIVRAGDKRGKGVSPEIKKITETTDIILEDIETPMKKLPVVISKADDRSQRKPAVKPVMTQTENKQRRAKQVQFLPEEESGIHVTDTICPPPLFFNSLAEERLQVPRQPTHPSAGATTSTPLWYEAEESDTASIASDISGVGVIESHYKFAGTQTTPFSIRKTTRKPPSPQRGRPASATPRPAAAAQQPAAFPQDLPLLQALLQELSRIQGVPLQQVPPPSQHRAATPRRQPKPQTPLSAYRTPTKGKENVKVPSRFSSLQQPSKPARKKHADCATPPKRVSANVGWLRQEPVYGKKKTKLSYGLTNTLRLRLQRNNPELLHYLEEQEFQKRAPEAWDQDSMLEGDVSVDVGRHQDDEPIAKPLNFGDTQTLQSPRRKPVPTPRKSKTTASDESVRDTEVAPVEPLDLKSLVTVAKEIEDEKSGTSSSARSGKNIEVHMPSITTHPDSEDSSDATDKEFDNEEDNAPGFQKPEVKDVHEVDAAGSGSDRYSEDFEESQVSDEKSPASEYSKSAESEKAEVSEGSYSSQEEEGSHRSQTSQRSDASLRQHSSGSQHSKHSVASQSVHSQKSDASGKRQEYYLSSDASSDRSRSYSGSSGSVYSDEDSDLGIGYIPSVLEVIPKPSTSSRSPRHVSKTITLKGKGTSAYEPIGSTPTAESKDSAEFKSVTVSVSSLGVSDEAF